jgi:hypothetical protein
VAVALGLGGVLVVCAALVLSPAFNSLWGWETRHALLQSLDGCREVRGRAQYWMARSVSGGCPSLADLVDAGLVPVAHTVDWWGTAYAIQCESSEVIHVISAGRDRIIGTADDVRDDFTPADVQHLKTIYERRFPPMLW